MTFDIKYISPESEMKKSGNVTDSIVTPNWKYINTPVNRATTPKQKDQDLNSLILNLFASFLEIEVVIIFDWKLDSEKSISWGLWRIACI